MRLFDATTMFFAFVALGLAIVDTSLAGAVINEEECASRGGECAADPARQDPKGEAISSEAERGSPEAERGSPVDDDATTPARPFRPLPGTVRITRESRLSLRDFYERYADLQKPVIVTDYAFAFGNFSVQNINSACGEMQVPVSRRTKDPDKVWAGLEEEHNSGKTLSEVLKDPSLGEDDRTVGVFDWSLPAYCPKLVKEQFKVPKYFAQDFLQRIPPTELDTYRDTWPSLFVGAAGSYGGLHRDVFGSAFWQYVVEGEKEWHIVDYLDKSHDLFSTNSSRPHGVMHYHDVLRPGELLIIGGNSWHQVRNGPTSRTVSVCGNFISRGSMSSMKNEMKPYLDKGENPHDYRLLWDVFFENPFNETIDMDRGDMNWDEFKTQYKEAFPLAVVVSGAGSPEVNGRYEFTEVYEGAGQFEKINKDGSAFEIFRVDDSDWWNILERAPDGSYPHSTTYGALRQSTPWEKLSEFFPPLLGWTNQNNESWRGAWPYPKITVLRSFSKKENGEVDRLEDSLEASG